MKVLVTGAAGQLGYDVVNELTRRGIAAVGTDIREENDLTERANWSEYLALDITDRSAVEKTVGRIAPDAIIHCAAWTNVDGAEDEKNRATVERINVFGTENLALAAKKAGCKFLYISTDYVFDGTGTRPWQPDDVRFAPQNWYGETKLQGETAVSTLLEKYFIVRIAWVFGKNGKNFVKTMLKLADKGCKELRVVDTRRTRAAISVGRTLRRRSSGRRRRTSPSSASRPQNTAPRSPGVRSIPVWIRANWRRRVSYRFRIGRTPFRDI